MSRTNLIGLIAVMLAIPAWVFLILAVPNGNGFGGSSHRYVVAPIALLGVTAAIHHLLRSWKNAWAIAAAISGVGLVAFLFTLAFMAG